jgi:hypothetical protein
MAQAVGRRFSLQRPGFAPSSVHVVFVVGKVALGQAFLRVHRFPLSVLLYSRQTMRWSLRVVNILSAVRGSTEHAGGQKTSYWSALR